MAQEDELHEYKMSVKDSYAGDGGMPEYSALFYTLADISVTSKEWLGLGAIKNYQTTPTTTFDFEIRRESDTV